MQPVPPCSAPACWWRKRASGILLHWKLHLGAWSVGFIYLFFSPGYVALWDSKTPHRSASGRVSWCLETSLPSWLPPWDGFLSLTLLPLFLSFIFCPTSFGRQWAAFLGAWCPPLVFRSCFMVFAQRSNGLLMNLWERKCLPILFLHHLRIAPP